ncbi:MAG: RNA 2',3'-cyclic phosphodiesterase [Candidatus Staskawiczbacteria bacterium]|jgi:2'-5' RNA ligase
MDRRIFIAINLPENVKEALAAYANKWPELPAKWTKPDNLHITAVFIGYISDEALIDVCNGIKEFIKGEEPFVIRLDKVCYGPPVSEGQVPRMVWAVADESQQFISLCDKLTKRILSLPNVAFRPDRKKNMPHITLARIREWEWRRIELDERPEVEDYIDLEIPVESIEVMESQLKRGGPEYTILESFELK